MNKVIYIYLLEEAVDVWRPAEAEQVQENVFRILGTVPEDEVWEFQPGQTVRCQEKIFHGGERCLVAMELEFT